MVPSVGRIVHYKLSTVDAGDINRLRDDALSARSDSAHLGFVVRVGNAVKPGDTYPMMIVKTWGDTEQSPVNGQVHLDGDDLYWVQRVTQGKGDGQWQEPPRP